MNDKTSVGAGWKPALRFGADFFEACRRHSVRPTRFVLVVEVRTQTMWLVERRHDLRTAPWNPEPKSGNLRAPASWSAAVPCRFWSSRRIESARGLAHSKTWRLMGSALFRNEPWTEHEPVVGRAARRRSPTGFVESLSKGLNYGPYPNYEFRRRFRVSTSRFGVGQRAGSNKTPLGLHRIAAKIGGGHPMGTAFRSRRPVGLIWEGRPHEPIVHRILWLEGLEPGFNRGGDVDSYRRYIYIHGTPDEITLGRPASRGCIHLAAADLLPLFNHLPVGTLVWIQP